MESFSLEFLRQDLVSLAFYLFEGESFTPGVLSALFIGILIVTASAFLAYSAASSFRSKWRIRFYSQMLEGVTPENLAEKRESLVAKAKKANGKLGPQWLEFDESLVLKRDGSGRHCLYNTLDAGYFFNTHTLARGLTENRLLAAVPGFLTAIGVIGTFAGLQMGLAGIDLGTGEIENLKSGIYNVIQGASVAFLTSVWGISLSVLFNFVEKVLERGVRASINKLQNRIDYLYPRINADESLADIATSSATSAETMQGLAEKIGDKMQEALLQTADSISLGLKDSLHEVLAPALTRMAVDAQSGSEKALESLLDQFMEKVGEAGTDQRSMMNQASSDVTAAVGKFGQEATEFASNMKTYVDEAKIRDQEQQTAHKSIISEQERRGQEQMRVFHQQMDQMSAQMASLMEKTNMANAAESERQRHLSEELSAASQSQVSQLAEANKTQIDQVAIQVKSIMDQMGQSSSRQIAEQRELNEEHARAANQQVEGLTAANSKVTERVEHLMSMQDDSFQKIVEKLNQLSDSFNKITSANTELARGIESSATHMNSSSEQLAGFGRGIEGATQEMGIVIDRALNSADDLSQRNLDAVEQLSTVIAQYQNFAVEVTQTVDLLKQASQHAENGFVSVEKNLNGFAKNVGSQFELFKEKMDQQIVEYAKQVREQTIDRINTWTEHTQEYTGEMSRVVGAISSIVGEVEATVDSINLQKAS